MSTIRRASLWLAFTAAGLVVANAASAQQQPPPQQPVMVLEQPQQPAQPPPGYGQPVYGQQPQYGYGPPAQQQPVDPTAGWESGDPVPAGYRVDSSPRYVLVGIGAGMLGGGWIVSALIGSTMINNDDDNGYKLLIPIAGPLLLMQDTDGPLAGLADGFLLFDAAVQTAGAVMLVLGFVLQRERLVADPRAGMTAFLTPTENGVVGGLGGRF